MKIAAPKPPIGGLELQVALDAEAVAMPAHKAVGIASPNPTHYREIPTRVSYALTLRGCRVAEALVPLCSWGSKNMADVSWIFERDTCRDGKGS